MKEYQVSGPSWMSSELYDIFAKAAGPASDSQMKPMLQTLLADRFKLALHREKKELQVYALVQGKNPPKLHPSDDSAQGSSSMGWCRRSAAAPRRADNATCAGQV